jgi:tRNA-2-methylthio-N6-dimethylallyladenosine synthase
MGCMAQREKDDLLKKHPAVDLVVGTDQFVHMPQLLDQFRERGRLSATDFGDFEDTLWEARRPEGVNAWIPIMRGCNYNCTYCIVPTTRGREKSRRPELIEDEVRRLVDQGFVQVTLLGQTIDAYGKTLGDGTSLASLLRRLDRIPGLKRIRFITSHPLDISDDLLDTMRDLPTVARHLHVPAQSGSDRILRLMGRRYTRADYLRLVERARARMPDIELQSDFIVGFPRETDEDFAETESLMREVRFAGSYVFMYSVRPTTPATRLDDDIPEAVKNQRCNRLLQIQTEWQATHYKTLVGGVQQVLIEGRSKGDAGMLHGRGRGFLNVMLAATGPDGTERSGLVGTIVPVRIERTTALTLFGELV